MADNDAGEKSELPTPRKLEHAREEGQVALSHEVTTAVLLLSGFASLAFLGPSLYQGMAASLRDCLGDGQAWRMELPATWHWLLARHQSLGLVLGAFLGLAFLTALVCTLGQVGLHISGKPLVPKWDRISPWAGLKRLFGMRGLMRFVFSLVKLSAILAIAWWALRSEVAQVASYGGDLDSRWVELCWLLLILGFKLAGSLGIIAAADYLYQRFQHTRDLMMTKQEIKDEMKQSEGDPLLKGRIRQIQRQMAQQRMMQEVPKADVVITNPTHVAVALKYDRDKMAAPVVVAKGYDLVAQHIKRLAAEAGVIQVENIDLARALAKKVKVGRAIPVDFYHPVAEVLGRVFKLKKAAAPQ